MENNNINSLKKETAVKKANKPDLRNNGSGNVLTSHDKLLKTEKEQEEEIKSIIAKNNHLLTVLAHDLKAPIGSIVGFLSLMADRVNTMDIAKIESNIYIALLSAKKTFALLENLLEWAFAENSMKGFKQEHTNLNELINEAKDSVIFSAIQKQIKIEIESFELLKVFIDQNMIKSVLRNLINNAIKFTHPEGQILISAIQRNGSVEISIKDSGIGIKKEVQESIFLSNYNSATQGTDNEPGTGLGLMFCKEFITKHGGKIWIISEPGMGSEFKFTLPISAKS